MAALLAKLKAALAARGPPKINTGTSIAARVTIEDDRLKFLNTFFGKLVLFYAIYLIFINQVFWEKLPAVPVTLAGKLEPALRKSYGGMYRPSQKCSQEQNQHCGLEHDWDDPISNPDTANCSILSPMDLNLGSLLFQDRLYVTTKQKYYTRESVCAGMVADIDGDGKLSAEEPCIGTESSGPPHEGSDKVIYTAGIEFLKMHIVHAMFNPWQAEQKKHCLVPGDIPMAPISESSACKDYLMDPAVGSNPFKWTDGDALAAMSAEGQVTAHGTCADGDVLLLDQLLRASDMDSIEEAAEETGGLEECGVWDTVMQIFPWGSFWPLNCPTEESIREATWNRDKPHFLLDVAGAIKQEVRDTGAKLHVTIQYQNSLALWPIWPFTSPTDINYVYKVHLLAKDEEKTRVTERVSSTEWIPRFNPSSPTCKGNPGTEANPTPGCVEYVMNQTMVDKNGLIVTFGQQGNIGSTTNWLTLIIASMATVSVMNGKINSMVTGVATGQLKYTGSIFMTKPVNDAKISTVEMMKQTFPMMVFMFAPNKIWARIKNMNCMKVDPGRKEVYIWNGFEYGFVERPEVDADDDVDGDGIFSIAEQKAAREKRAAAANATSDEYMKNPLAVSGAPKNATTFEIDNNRRGGS